MKNGCDDDRCCHAAVAAETCCMATHRGDDAEPRVRLAPSETIVMSSTTTLLCSLALASAALLASNRLRIRGGMDFTANHKCSICLDTYPYEDDEAARRPVCRSINLCTAGLDPNYAENLDIRPDSVTVPNAACRLEDFVMFLSDLNPDAEVVLSCGHHFHSKCLRHTMNYPAPNDQHLKCPMCKRPFFRCKIA